MSALGQQVLPPARVRKRNVRLEVNRRAPDGTSFVTIADLASILAGAMIASAKVNEIESRRDADRVLVSLANAFDSLGRAAEGTRTGEALTLASHVLMATEK